LPASRQRRKAPSDNSSNWNERGQPTIVPVPSPIREVLTGPRLQWSDETSGGNAGKIAKGDDLVTSIERLCVPEQQCARHLTILSVVLFMIMHDAQAQPLTIDPESIVPLPDKFDMEMPATDVPPEIARFHGAWIGTWHDDRHILVAERVKPDGHAKVVFAQADSAFHNMKGSPPADPH
jgi:hypothetical protein